MSTSIYFENSTQADVKYPVTQKIWSPADSLVRTGPNKKKKINYLDNENFKYRLYTYTLGSISSVSSCSIMRV